MDIPPLAVSVGQACRLTGLGRTSLFAAIKRRDLTARKAGRRTLLEISELRRFLGTLPATNDANRSA